MGQAVQTRHVVFVHMAQDDQVHRVQLGADAVGHLGRVKGHAHVSPLHDQLVPVGVFAGLLAQVHPHRTEIQNRGHARVSLCCAARHYSQRDSPALAHALQ